MRSATPPKLASWLLYHQVSGYRAESLVGDLTEEYAQGRGAGWFWRQVLLAVASSHVRALRLYGLRFLAAVAAGWGTLLTGNALLGRMWGIIQHELSTNSTAQQLQIPGLLYQVAWTLLAACIDFVVGRLVVRIYRPHPRLMASIFSLTILLYMLPSIYRQLIAAVDDSASVPFLVRQLIATFLWMSSAWFGGLWQIRIDTKAGQEKRQ